MTKKEWENLRAGHPVKKQSSDWDENKKIYTFTIFGEVVRMNSNHSQALVLWDFYDTGIWYGRLGLELE